MNKSIKVRDEVYKELEELRAKRETFSDVVGRLLAARPHLLKAAAAVRSYGAAEVPAGNNGGGQSQP